MEPDEIANSFEGAILNSPDGLEVGVILSGEFYDEDQQFIFQVQNTQIEVAYEWTVDRQEVVGLVDSTSSNSSISDVIAGLFIDGVGNWSPEPLAESSTPPGPGDPDLDL